MPKMDKKIIRISREKAIKIVEKWPDKRIHCFLGSIGCDWNKKDIIKEIKNCKRIAWVWNIFNHNLTIISEDNHQYNFDIPHKLLRNK